MRSFVAIEVSDKDVLNSIHKIQTELNIKAKPVELHNMHFTVQFLGEISEEMTRKISGALNSLEFTPFLISFVGIASKITLHLKRWKNGDDSSEPVARFLRTYSIYLNEHMSREEDFFERAEKEVLSKEEEKDMFEDFQSAMAITKKMESILKEIDNLENQQWFKN